MGVTVPSDKETIIRAEQQLASAHLTLDIGMIATLLHEEYVILQPNGVVETRQEVLDSYRSGERHWDRAEIAALDVKIYGNTARVVGIWKAIGIHAGESFDYQARFVSIWIRQAGEWKNLSYAASEITPTD